MLLLIDPWKCGADQYIFSFHGVETVLVARGALVCVGQILLGPAASALVTGPATLP